MLGQAKLIILAILARQPLHGYGILKEIREKSNGCCSITVGTIYPGLKELELEGLVRYKKKRIKNRERMIYEITAKGSKVYAEGLKRWVEFTEGAKKLLMVDPP